MLDKEQRIKEQRTILAINKGFMGLGGKFACIASSLGSPIINETSGFFSESYLDDVWLLDNSDDMDLTKVHNASEDILSEEIGFVFDGLSRGMHLEIKYLIVDKSITVYYKGIKVYREVSGDLDSYAPYPEWETLIDKLYKVAKKIANREKQVQSEELKEVSKKRMNSFLEQLRLRWESD